MWGPTPKPSSQTIRRQVSKRDKNRPGEYQERMKNSAVILFEADIRLPAPSAT